MPQTLCEWVKRDEIDTGSRAGITAPDMQCLKELERENKELRGANPEPPTQVSKDFIDEHRDTNGVEPICKVLQVAPSGDWRDAALTGA